MSRQVICITKRGNHYNPHERIQAIGGLNWSRSENDAIRDVEADPSAYYTSVGGRSVWVVVDSRLGRKYLKTEPDAYPQNNLLSLPECPR